MKAAFDKVGADGAPALEADILGYLEDVNENDRALVLEPEYLQIVAVRAITVQQHHKLGGGAFRGRKARTGE